ncbi:hypothetical protein [Methylorubrum populi]|uniref:hypothetical protein n=1 Tax=Methylorubrum populi TaxID=223967 RepID=UPI003F65B8B1
MIDDEDRPRRRTPMVGAERAAVQNPLSRVRQARFPLRRGRILPGPLKPVDARSRRSPAWLASVGVVSLALVATWAIAAQIRAGGEVSPRSAPVAVAASVPEGAASVRVVGAVPAPQAVSVEEPTAPLEAPLAAAQPQPAFPAAAAPTFPASKPIAALPDDLGALPVLELDESAFEAVRPPTAEQAPRPNPRALNRH